ncbi:MAG TPA: SDR family NAD(P)-dependent oxidoreductase [Ramlibacter sp.]|nr:SDR family NAD(P)-dependent oxidoreductase [Ramlibacter sp.]
MPPPHPVVIITGATSGLGAAMTRCYVESGARVVAIGRDAQRLARVTRQLGPLVTPLTFDVADHAAVTASLASLPPEFAQPTILINNAGVSLGNARVPDVSMADWQRMLDTNVRGVLNLAHAVLPGMIARNHGDVVNIGSIAAHLPSPSGSVYGASKAFVSQFTRNLRADLLGKNIRVMCIEPGVVRTGFAAHRLGSQEAAREFYRQPNLLEPQDIAKIVFFCTALPRRVNVNGLEVTPISQGFSASTIAFDMPELQAEGDEVAPGA